MEWIRKHPTQEGWYARLEHHRNAPYIRVLEVRMVHGELCDDYLDPLSDTPDGSYYWYGPIELPPLPEYPNDPR